jgi:hypothetical protein
MRCISAASLLLLLSAAVAAQAAEVKSLHDGKWSDAKTWAGGHLPAGGDTVVIAAGTRVVYDADSAAVLPAIRVAGVLSFARDRNTTLHVAVLRVGDGDADDAVTGVEDVHDHDHAHHHAAAAPDAAAPQPTLEVGTVTDPIPAPFTARIALHYIDGMDKDKAPAIICRPGARMDFAGAPMNRTWVKLGDDVKVGDATVKLAEPVTGWRVGDEVIVTASAPEETNDGKAHQTERLRITKIEGQTLTLDKPLAFAHYGHGDFRSEVANLSRTVVVESAAPYDVPGHTMYHYDAAGSISYARFDHLGKPGSLGRYPIHFHQVRDTMRGSSVVGAAIVDSFNRWVTIHGTDYMVIRDCVGYRSRGHGFFLEDGSESYNVFDRNLGVGAANAPQLPHQALPFDPNDGAAFWWANGRNTFVRNVACENDHYGYRYDSHKSSDFDAMMDVRTAGGSTSKIDIRTIPIFRFQNNETHSEGLYGFAFAGTAGVGPDTSHPHTLRDLSAWQVHYALRSELPTMWVENVVMDHDVYGVYRPWFDHHVYRNISMNAITAEPFNRGMDDDSYQHGPITVDGLTFSGMRGGNEMPLIQISDDGAAKGIESHFRNVQVGERGDDRFWPLVNLGGGTRDDPKTPNGVPVYLHDWYGPGRTARIVSTKAKDQLADGRTYKKEPPLTGDSSVVTEVSGVEFPQLLKPIDDQPPATAILWPSANAAVKAGDLVILGTTTDDTATKRVTVNGVAAEDIGYNFHQWRVTLKNVKPSKLAIEALAEDAAGNVERTPHKIVVEVK